MEPVLIDPQDATKPLILYLDANKRLQVGTWVTTNNGQVTTNNILFTKFGSTVAITQKNASDTWGSGDIAFNPTSTLNATWENNGAAGYTAIPHWATWPGTKPGSYSVTANANEVSKSPYHTLKNVKAGFGDICQLVGYTVENIAAWDELPPPTYRLPTNPENSTFVGLTSTAAAATNITSSTYFRWTSGSPGYGTFPIANAIFPAVGQLRDLNYSDSVNEYNADGHWWSSTPKSATIGYMLQFRSGSVIPSFSVSDQYSSLGFNVRCVPY